jgi:SPP1 gp7 family putative phage head morphogenesis protein
VSGAVELAPGSLLAVAPHPRTVDLDEAAGLRATGNVGRPLTPLFEDKQAVQQAVERWYGNGEPLSALIDDLQPAFSKKRARLIAATETTRASAQGNLLGYKESGVVTGLVFKTAKDEHVCAFCGGLDGKIVSIEGGSFYDELTPELQSKLKRRFDVPPVHPNCRCRISAQVLTPEDAQRQARGGI